MREYPEIFYRRNMLQGRSTARETVPLVMELIGPKSVVDVGCSAGTWLAVFEECGVKDVFGIDGFYARKELLEIPQERFLAHACKSPSGWTGLSTSSSPWRWLSIYPKNRRSGL